MYIKFTFYCCFYAMIGTKNKMYTFSCHEIWIVCQTLFIMIVSKDMCGQANVNLVKDKGCVK